MDLEEVWRIREEEIYPRLFGSESRGIFPLTGDIFTSRFGQSTYDPRWLFYGVFEFAPTFDRPFWLYVTSAHSNPWEDEAGAYDPNGASGSGVEFLFASSQQGDWAIRFLQNMLAFDILLSAGRFEGRSPLTAGDRIPLRSPIDGLDVCEIRNAVVSRAEGLPAGFSLPSGNVEFLTFTGVTDREIDFAKAESSQALMDRLRVRGHFPVTDPLRPSVL